MRKYPPLQEGSVVRVLKKAGKGSERKESWNDFDDEQRTVVEIKDESFPVLYVLNGATRGYMRHELLKLEA